jgi:hypothetical protein
LRVVDGYDTVRTPGTSPAVDTVTVGAVTVTVYVAVTGVIEALSVTLTRRAKAPSAVGVPLNTPAAFSVMPVGRPDVALQAYGGVPPTACSVVTVNEFCTAAMGATVGVSVAVAAGAGEITSPND